KDIFECPGPLTYYKDLGCTPIYDNKEDNCPKSFNCNHIKQRSRNKCYINGHIYNSNQLLNPIDSNFCDTSCICRVLLVQNQIMEEIPVCNVNGHIYLDDESFKVDEESDLICTCQPGYKGETVPPFCIKPNCSPCLHPAFSHDDYFRRNCAPVFNDYAEKNTCYMTMLCQAPDDIVIPRRLPFIMDDNYTSMIIYLIFLFSDMCIFGNLLLQIGDKLQPSPDYIIDCINCICEVSPY
ncbi:hypothetical protein ALC53_02078, partial [Atta colombica]